MQSCNQENKRISKNTLLSTVIILFVIPLNIALGVVYFDNKTIFIISLLIVLYTLIAFFAVFEKRKPQTRELVIISTLSAVAVAGRAAFIMIPQFKPVIAIVIITGVCFGPTSGFLVGAISAFVSNMFFGQGLWTPWQMFCFGIIGFLAGVLFQKGVLSKQRISLCIFGGISTIVIYGGIINFGSLMMFTKNFSWIALMATYAAGIPFDLAHAVSTVFFLLIFSTPMIEILDRIKKKYGLMEPN